MARQGSRVKKGDKGHAAVGDEFGHPAVTGKTWITIFVMHQTRLALGGHLHGGATIGSHGPQVAPAIPQENVFKGELQTQCQALELGPYSGEITLGVLSQLTGYSRPLRLHDALPRC